MSEQQGEKTEEPTPKKLQDAREEGKSPRSQELSAAFLLLGASLVMATVIPSTASDLMVLMGTALSNLGESALGNDGVIKLAQMIGWKVLLTILPVALSMAGVSLAIGAFQNRGILTSKPLAPKWERLSPLNNAKRIFGKQALVELVKAVLKVAIVGFAIYTVVNSSTIDDILITAQTSPVNLLAVLKKHTSTLLLTAGIAYIFLAIGDFIWQRWQFGQQMKMTKEEVKRELKSSDGDPLVKQRMRSIARNMARRQMFRNVPKADVVIVNPTHRAIALEYDPVAAPAPTVLAMGERKVAERIKRLAMEHGIPVVENRPLAAALIESARVGTMIPADLYVAVAEVLAFVIQQRQSYKRNWGYQRSGALLGSNR